MTRTFVLTPGRRIVCVRTCEPLAKRSHVICRCIVTSTGSKSSMTWWQACVRARSNTHRLPASQLSPETLNTKPETRNPKPEILSRALSHLSIARALVLSSHSLSLSSIALSSLCLLSLSHTQGHIRKDDGTTSPDLPLLNLPPTRLHTHTRTIPLFHTIDRKSVV